MFRRSTLQNTSLTDKWNGACKAEIEHYRTAALSNLFWHMNMDRQEGDVRTGNGCIGPFPHVVRHYSGLASAFLGLHSPIFVCFERLVVLLKKTACLRRLNAAMVLLKVRVSQ
jgi:hypothetical protein